MLGRVIVGASLLVLLALNLRATLQIRRETSGTAFTVGTLRYDPRPRRVAQLLLVWLVPVLGALVVMAMYGPRRPPREDYSSSNQYSTF